MAGIKAFSRAADTAGRAFSIVAVFERGLSRSDDGGETWTPWPTEEAIGILRAIALGPDGKIYAASERGLYRATWGAAAWEKVDVPGATGLRRVLFAPDRTLLVTTADTPPALFARPDKTTEWQRLDVPGLREDSPIIFLESDLLIGTAQGVILYRPGRGAESFGDGLTASVLSLSGTDQGDVVVAGTAGQGAWLFSLPIYKDR
jgi:hypothetical protein